MRLTPSFVYSIKIATESRVLRLLVSSTEVEKWDQREKGGERG
jgi:hypothetical protein